MDKDILHKALEIGVEISKENDYHKLLSTIIEKCSDIANCDAGTLYLKKDNKLHFIVMLNKTFNQYQGYHGEEINIPPVEMTMTNVCSYVALTKERVNIKDVYNDESFNWSGPKKYDSITGYHTQSMVVIPLIDKEDEVIGVIQLLNAKDNEKTIPFSEDIEYVIYSIASQAAMLLSNMLLKEDMEELLNSMVTGLTTAIDSRTPYNANHSRNVASLCSDFAKYLKDNNLKDITDNDIEQLYMAGMLHDVGKMIIPLEVMDKATRLEDKLKFMEIRFKYIGALIERDYANNSIDENRYTELSSLLNETRELTIKINQAGFLMDDLEKRIKELSKLSYNGVNFIEDDELECLLIKKGTLTANERKKIEEHSVYSHNILSKIKFGKKYDKVLEYASKHHEYLDGSGYPNHVKEDELNVCSRIMTIMDIFESLTAKDRPYKKEMPVKKAYAIVESIANEGKIDKELVTYLKEYLKSKGENIDE